MVENYYALYEVENREIIATFKGDYVDIYNLNSFINSNEVTTSKRSQYEKIDKEKYIKLTKNLAQKILNTK